VNRIKAGVFSLTVSAASDADYLRWHLLDHMPEQFQLPGIQQALRYIADGDYRDARLAADGALADVGNLVTYLVGDPVEQTLADFLALGARLANAGRFPVRRPSLQLSALPVVSCTAAPAAAVSGEVLPWRPHRGVFLLVEAGDSVAEDPDLLGVPGVAGVWRFGAPDPQRSAPWHSSPHETTLIYLDADPIDTATALTPLIERRWATGTVRPLFAGPLRSMIEWEVWPR
jgi:hypothetical protein